MITIEHLTKRYGDKVAVDDISLTIKSGEIVGFLGPNGAGKTTTMNMITGYLSSTAGTVEIDGISMQDSPIEAKRQIGFLPRGECGSWRADLLQNREHSPPYVPTP